MNDMSGQLSSLYCLVSLGPLLSFVSLYKSSTYSASIAIVNGVFDLYISEKTQLMDTVSPS